MANNRKHYRLSRDKLLFVTIAGYFLIGLALIPVYQYHINPDGVSYISIAEKYSRGEWQDAINGYWGPLYIWVMGFFIRLGIDSVVAAKLVLLLFGSATLIAARLLSYRFDINQAIRNIFFVAMVPALLFFSFAFITADLVLLTSLLFYFSFIFDEHYSKKRFRGAMCGIMGGLLYLSKAYGFPFFLVHFILMNLYYYFKEPERRDKVLKHTATGFLLFFIISGIWISIISNKYDKLIIGTAAQFNHTINYPGFDGFHVYHMGFIEPANTTAVAIGEDHFYLPHIKWSPFDSPELFRYSVHKILQNNYGTLKIISGLWAPYYTIFTPVFALAFVLYVIVYLFPLGKIHVYRLLWIISPAIFAMGYTPLVIRERFLWVIFVIGVLITGHLMTLFFRKSSVLPVLKYGLLYLVALSFVFAPARNLWRDRYKGKELYEFSQKIDACVELDGDIASDTRYQKTFFTAFYLDCRYFGRVKKPFTPQEVYADLYKYGIDYFFVWLSPTRFPFLEDFEELTKGCVSELRIYKVPEK
jgi:hypothetical protein